MKNICLFFLLALLIAACNNDDKEKDQLMFVTNIAIVDAEKTFNPGDAVTVKANGFRNTDNLILDIYWPLKDNPLFPEGYSRYNQAVTTEQTAGSITFLAPGHWPASRVELFLEREGLLMHLGNINVTDGQAPEEPYLYGITNSRSISTPDAPRGIVRYDLATKEMSEVIRFNSGEDFRLVSNIPGNNILCGIREQDGNNSISGYDLCMNYWFHPRERSAITLCSDCNQIISVEALSGESLTYSKISYPVYTRLNMPSVHFPEIPLPDGLKPESLSRYPGAIADNQLLLSANNGDGTFSPVVIDITKERLYRYDPIKTDALIPFWIMEPDFNKPNSLLCKGGYIVSRANGGETQFCLWNTTTGTLEAPFATYPNAVISATMYFSKDKQTRKLYVQFAGNREGDFIDSYDFQTKEWKMFTFFVPFAEIVLAR